MFLPVGTPLMKPVRMNTVIAPPNPQYAKIAPGMDFSIGMPMKFPTSRNVEISGSMTTWNGMIMDAIKIIYITVAHAFLLLRLMTHAAMEPNRARRMSETIVIHVEDPRAVQKLKFELLTTLETFETNCENEAPNHAIGLATGTKYTLQ